MWKEALNRSSIAMEAPISSIGADTLLALLDSHSDIEPISLTALACTSKDFAEAVDNLWPSKMKQYATKCEEKAAPPTPLMTIDETVYDFETRRDLLGGFACEYYGDKVKPDSEKYSVHFEFDTPDTIWNRKTAMVPVHMARRRYFVKTEDIRTLPIILGSSKQKFYRFADVLQAAMLRHGRDGLAKKMMKICDRVRRKGEMYSDRLELVKFLVIQHYSEPEHLLTPDIIQTYCSEYYNTGRGGFNEVQRRFAAHRGFSILVSRRASTSLSTVPFLSREEQERVAHLQISFVLAHQIRCLDEAISIITNMRLA